MGASADAVSDRMRRLAGVARGFDAFANRAVDFAEWCAIAHASDAIRENFEELIEQSIVFCREFARNNIFR